MGPKRTRWRRHTEAAPSTPDDGDARLQVPADATGELVIRTTNDGRYTYVSPAVREILGYEPEELLARRWSPASTTSPR